VLLNKLISGAAGSKLEKPIHCCAFMLKANVDANNKIVNNFFVFIKFKLM
jgi:hypothetical protein